MSTGFIIGDDRIDQLKHHLLHDFKDYAEFYAKRNGEPIADRRKKFQPIWTEYINGSKTKREDRRWPGVFRRWLEEFNPDEPIWQYEQSGIDCTLRSGNDGVLGDYKILVVLRQANDPDAVTLHTREMYDYNVPEKVVLIWSAEKRSDIKEIADEARRVPELAAARDVRNLGNIHVLVANRQIRDWWLGNRPDPPDDQFECVTIESAFVNSDVR